VALGADTPPDSNARPVSVRGAPGVWPGFFRREGLIDVRERVLKFSLPAPDLAGASKLEALRSRFGESDAADVVSVSSVQIGVDSRTRLPRSGVRQYLRNNNEIPPHMIGALVTGRTTVLAFAPCHRSLVTIDGAAAPPLGARRTPFARNS